MSSSGFLGFTPTANGWVIRETLPDGGIWQCAYTLSGSTVVQTVVTDPRGNTTTYAFNAAGYPTSITNPLGQTTTLTRESPSNLITQVVDPLNRTTVFGRDANKNVTSVTRYLDPPANTQPVTSTFTYELTYNQVTSATDPLGHTTTFGRDAKGDVTSITDPLTHTTTLTRNSFGQPTAITDALNNTTTFAYDTSGNLASVTDPLGNSTTRTSDLLSRLVRQTDPRGYASQFTYDLLNRVTTLADPLGHGIQFEYDGNSNLTKVTDPRNNFITYTYDTMDRVATRTDQLGQAETYTYDLAGNSTSFRDRKNQTTTFTSDALNRRTATTYADASTVTATYDAGGRLTSLVDSVAGTITWTYDALDRVTSETTPQGTLTYVYDNANRRTTMTVAGQSPVSYSYDVADRLMTISRDTLVASYAHDNANRRTSLTLPNGVTTDYAYDLTSRLTGLTYRNGATSLGSLTYTYDKAGNRTVTGGSWARTLLPDPITTASYDAANRQLTLGGKTMTFDANGNLTGITEGGQTTTYTWDVRDQLASLSGAVTASFAYDTLGRRRQKTAPNQAVTTFQYDGWDIAREVIGPDGINYLRGLGIDEPLARIETGSTTHYLSDSLGSALALADGAGGVATSYTYGPFGQTTSTGAGNSNPFQFTGRESDGTGLYYFRARYYHPSLARFVSEDPLGFGAALNPYRYSRNNPVAYVDPSGLCEDPGGPGLRYRIERYIPTASSGGFEGDDRGPNANGGTFRIRQWMFQDPSGETSGDTVVGLTRTAFPPDFARQGVRRPCSWEVMTLKIGGRKIRARCAAGNGFLFGLAPDITYDVTIFERRDGTASVVNASGSPYPSMEIWQYGGSGGPRLIYDFDANKAGTNPWDLYFPGPLPLP